MLQSRIFYVANMYFNTNPENKTFGKISEFTVFLSISHANIFNMYDHENQLTVW